MNRWLYLAGGLVVGAAGLWLIQRTPSPAGLPAVVAQIQQLNELATVRYTIQRVISLTEEKSPVGAESILIALQARVQAGVDLAGLQARDVSTRPDGAMVIRLPAARVLDVAIDEKETKVWDRRITWWTPWVPYSLDLEKKARLEGLSAAEKAAIEMGILKQAEKNAETSVRGLLNLVGIKTVVIAPGSVS